MGRCPLRHARRASSHKRSNNGPTYKSVLGGLGVEMWHSQLGIAGPAGFADTWTGQWGGRVLPAPAGAQRPVYAADGAIFGGKSVVQTAVTGSLILYSGSLTSLAASGTDPWLYVRGRFRDATGTNGIAVSGGGTGRSIAVRNLFGNFGSSDITTTNVNSGVALNFVAHSLSGWADGTKLNLKLDATSYSAAYALSLQTDMTAFCVGASSQSGGAGSFCNFNAALIIVASAYPGATIAAAIDAMAVAEFPA